MLGVQTCYQAQMFSATPWRWPAWAAPAV